MREVTYLLGLFAGVAVVAIACWALTIQMAVDFSPTSGGVDWHTAGLGVLFLMWAVMMVAMMLPSFVPAAVEFARLMARQAASPSVVFSAFVGGYLLVWLGFSAAAAVLQYFASTQLTASLYLAEPHWRAALLAAAGAYQLTPFKFSCLKHCRSPIFLFLLHWRGSAWRMGVRCGLVCLGCCWLLMLLLFVGGVMDLQWIALLTVYVLVEKLTPSPQKFAQISGGVLLALAAAQIVVG